MDRQQARRADLPEAAQRPPNIPGDHDGFHHAALLYRSDGECLSTAAAFVRAALRRKEAVLAAVPGFRAGLLREALGEASAQVAFADQAVVGRNPGRIIPDIWSFLLAHPQRRAAVVMESAWPGRSTPELVETAKHEALSNLAFAGAPVSVLCLYDLAALPAEALAEAGPVKRTRFLPTQVGFGPAAPTSGRACCRRGAWPRCPSRRPARSK